MNKSVVFYIVMLGALLCSCSSTEQNDREILFERGISLSADSADIGVVIKPGNIYFVSPYIVVSDIGSTGNFHFAVFGQDLKYRYSFCRKGSGPDECLMPTVVKNTNSEEFIVRDHADDVWHSYILSDSGVVAIGEFKVSLTKPYESLWEVVRLSPDRYILKSVAPKRVVRKLMNITNGIEIDSLNPTFDLKSKMGNDYYTEFDDFWLVSNGRRFACAYYFINRIEFGQISEEGIHIDKYLGATTPPEFHKYTTEELSGKYRYNVDYNPVYFEWLYGSENRIYASLFGKPWGDIDCHSNRIGVFSYQGDPLVEYQLDVSLSSFIAIDDKTLIGINPERSDDYFYFYSI
ncbi:MAG: hypothetical protein NC336_07365 [Clostridium sp.]|nr:hypothetical protein [Clostridium sp.]